MVRAYGWYGCPRLASLASCWPSCVTGLSCVRGELRRRSLLCHFMGGLHCCFSLISVYSRVLILINLVFVHCFGQGLGEKGKCSFWQIGRQHTAHCSQLILNRCATELLFFVITIIKWKHVPIKRLSSRPDWNIIVKMYRSKSGLSHLGSLRLKQF